MSSTGSDANPDGLRRDQAWHRLAESMTRVAEAPSTDAMLQQTIESAMNLVPEAERALLCIDEVGSGYPYFRTGYDVDGTAQQLAGQLSRNLLAQALRDRIVVSKSLRGDHRFCDRESVQEMPDRSVIALGFEGKKGIRGVLYLDAGSNQLLDLGEREERLALLLRNAGPQIGLSLKADEAEVMSEYNRRRRAGELLLPGVLGCSQGLMNALERAEIIACYSVPWPVLVVGETGVGKEVIARAIHESGSRAQSPFIAFEAGALAPELARAELFGHERGSYTGADRSRKGLIREAEGGIFLLDDIDKLDSTIQGMFLRAIQDRTVHALGESREVAVDFQLIATTSRDPWRLVEEGKMLPDLFGRLIKWVIEVPPLRERPEDIIPMAREFVRRATAELQIEDPPLLTTEAEEKLLGYSYEVSNVRELQATVFRAVALSGGLPITEDHVEFTTDILPKRGHPVPIHRGTALEPLEAVIARAERSHLQRVLDAAPDRNTAATWLGIGRATLFAKMAKHEIK